MKVTLYSTHCSRCVVLEEKLEDAGVDFAIVDDPDVIKEKGFMSAPMLEVDDELMDFGKAVKWVNSL